ncbi:MAG: hypothetical protein FWF59_13380 [Turicibacter sp.]|nr:hypothetical protein [Turicibacter sp.]
MRIKNQINPWAYAAFLAGILAGFLPNGVMSVVLGAWAVLLGLIALGKGSTSKAEKVVTLGSIGAGFLYSVVFVLVMFISERNHRMIPNASPEELNRTLEVSSYEGE